MGWPGTEGKSKTGGTTKHGRVDGEVKSDVEEESERDNERGEDETGVEIPDMELESEEFSPATEKKTQRRKENENYEEETRENEKMRKLLTTPLHKSKERRVRRNEYEWQSIEEVSKK